MFAQKKTTLPPGRHKIVILDEADRQAFLTLKAAINFEGTYMRSSMQIPRWRAFSMLSSVRFDIPEPEVIRPIIQGRGGNASVLE